MVDIERWYPAVSGGIIIPIVSISIDIADTRVSHDNIIAWYRYPGIDINLFCKAFYKVACHVVTAQRIRPEYR